jgi:hypothetical protein
MSEGRHSRVLREVTKLTCTSCTYWGSVQAELGSQLRVLRGILLGPRVRRERAGCSLKVDEWIGRI